MMISGIITPGDIQTNGTTSGVIWLNHCCEEEKNKSDHEAGESVLCTSSFKLSRCVNVVKTMV